MSVDVSPARSTVSPDDATKRDLRLDLCRGLALWFIFLDHIPGNSLSWITLRNYGFSDTTEIFFFVSGYTCMIAYGDAQQRQGWRVTIARAMRRGWEIYAAFLLLFVAYLALIYLLGGGNKEYLDKTNTAVFFANPGVAIIHALTMQYTPVNTDVLTTFVLLHLSFPALLWMFRRNASITLGASLLLYLLVQIYSWNLPAWPRDQWFFNPLAWQVLFVFGAWYAGSTAIWLRRMIHSKTLLTIAVLYLVFSLAVSLSWHFHTLEAFMPDWMSKLIYPVYKSSLAPVRLLHFLALAVVVGRLLRRDWRGLMTPAVTAMIRCGENSLAIYCISVLLAFAGQVILRQVFDGPAMQIAVSLGGIAIMIAAASVLTWAAKLDRHAPKLF